MGLASKIGDGTPEHAGGGSEHRRSHLDLTGRYARARREEYIRVLAFLPRV